MTCDPRLLRSFVVLAEELHFGRAAERLHVRQPALSQQLKRLELQLGVSLFDRSRSRVELSEAGGALLAPARAAVEAVDATEATARALQSGEEGELMLGLSPGVHYVAQALLAEFARARPRVRIRARHDNSGALADQIARGELELGVGFCTHPAEGVACEALLDEPAVVAVAGEHRLYSHGEVSLAELAGETFALVDEDDGPGYNRTVVRLCREAGFEPKTFARPHGPMAWETAVRSHGCVGLTTRSAAPSTARGTHLLELRPAISFAVELVLPEAPASRARPAARAFAETARRMAAAGSLR